MDAPQIQQPLAPTPEPAPSTPAASPPPAQDAQAVQGVQAVAPSAGQPAAPAAVVTPQAAVPAPSVDARNQFLKDFNGFERDFGDHYQESQADEMRDFFQDHAQNQAAAQAAQPAAPAPAQSSSFFGGDKVAPFGLSGLVTGQQGPVAADGAPHSFKYDAMRDISLGLMQSPRHIVRGAINGINSMISFFGHQADYIPTISFFDKEGNKGLTLATGAQALKNEQKYLDKNVNPDLIAQGKNPIKTDQIISLPQIPNLDPAKVETVTGKGIELIAQFAVGFKAIDKISKFAQIGELGPAAQATANFLEGAGGAGKAAKMLGSATKGTLGELLSFGEQEKRLSNVIQEFPALQNPVTNYLQAKPDDGFFEGKMKQAIEGLGLGLVGEALFGGIRLLKQGKTAVQDVKEAGLNIDDLAHLPLSAKTGEQFQKEALNILGDVDDPRLVIPEGAAKPGPGTGTAAGATNEVAGADAKIAQAAKSTEGLQPGVVDTATAAQNGPIKINFARIEGPQDIKAAMQELANSPALTKDVQAARRGVVTDETLLKNADDVDGFATLMQRRTGQALNDQQTIAARKLYYDATDRLIEAARKAGSTTASSYDQYAFRRMMAIHHAVQQEVLGARAEAARALRSWSIPLSGGNMDRLRAVEDALSNFGGIEATQNLAKKLTLLSEGGKMTTEQINQITRGGALARTGKALQEVWQMGLLSSPRTHIVNIASNTLTGLTLGIERFGQALVKDSPVTMREAVEYFNGYLGSFKQGLANAAQAWKTGQTGFGIGKIEAPFERATSREILDPNGKAGVFSKALSWYGAALNKFVGGTLAAGDEFAKTVLYNAQLRALGARQAKSLGLEGQAIADHIAEVVSNPPPMVRSEAMGFADYGTYTNALEGGSEALHTLVNKWPPAKIFVPFVRTPLNIFKFTFERTPLGLMSKSLREDLSAGGARQAAALTKLGMGSSVMMLGLDMSLNGHITGAGPVDPEIRSRLQSNGWQPYSIKIGDKYYSYARFEPFATWLGMSSDMSEIMSNYESYDSEAQQEVDELSTAMVAAIANQVVGKTFLQGVSDMTQVLSDAKRFGPRYLQQYAGSLVPAVVADFEKAVSPEREQVFNMLDAIKSRIPGLSDSVPKRYNVYGETIKNYYPDPNSPIHAFGERVAQIFNPVYFSDKDAPSQKLDQWFLVNGIDGPHMPQKVQKFEIPGDFSGNKIAVDMRDYPEMYSRFLQKRAEVTLPKYQNMTMKQYLMGLVNREVPGSTVFFMGLAKNKDDQQKYIANVVSDYDKEIRKQLVEEFPTLSQIMAQERTKQIPLQQNSGGDGLVRTKSFP